MYSGVYANDLLISRLTLISSKSVSNGMWTVQIGGLKVDCMDTLTNMNSKGAVIQILVSHLLVCI